LAGIVNLKKSASLVLAMLTMFTTSEPSASVPRFTAVAAVLLAPAFS
jgi:hypothetical protein